MIRLLRPWATLPKPAQRVLMVHALQWQFTAMGTFFFQIYLFRLSAGYFEPALFVLLQSLATPFGFWLGKWAAKNRGEPAALRWGLLGNEVLFLSMLTLGTQSIHWMVPLAILSGLAGGIYWIGLHLLSYDLVDDPFRDLFMSLRETCYFAALLIGLPAAAFLAAGFNGLSGYPWIFASASTLCLAAWFISMKLPNYSRPDIQDKLDIEPSKTPGWIRIRASSQLLGLLSLGPLLLAHLLSVEIRGSEDGAGYYALVHATVGLLITWAATHFLSPQRRLSAMGLSALLTLLLCTPIALHRSFSTVLLFGAGLAVVQALHRVTLTSHHFWWIDRLPALRSNRDQLFLRREIWINGARAAGVGVLLLLVESSASPALTFILFALALLPSLNWALFSERPTALSKVRL